MSPLFAAPLAITLVKILKVTLLVVIVVAVLAGAFLLWASGGAGDTFDEAWRLLPVDHPDLGEPETGELNVTEAQGKLTVLTWNIAYGRGPKDDAGDLRDRETIVRYLEGIADAIVRSGADIVALQEVDFDSHRTHGIDELSFLAERLGWRYTARVTTWLNRYVPYPTWPPSQHYGAMRSGQAVLSRLPITRNARFTYPQPEAWSFWYNAFYLHRATQVVDVQVGERVVTLLNTHLEAFDEPNRERQARLLVDLLTQEAERKPGGAMLVLGDFNALPPEAAMKAGFVDEPEMDFTDDETIRIVREGLEAAVGGAAEVVARDAAQREERVTWTFPAEAPTRQLDHLFFTKALRLERGGVWVEAGPLSDHLPVRAVFRLP